MSIQEADIITYVQEHTGVMPTELASYLGVSTRALRTHFHRAQDLLEGCAVLELHKGEGYSLTITDQEAYQLRMDRVRAMGTSRNEPHERVACLLNDLLVRTGWVTVEELSAAFHASGSTISRDLKEVKTRLASFDLNLETRPRYGMRVVGSETNRRICMANNVVENISHEYRQRGSVYETLDERVSIDLIARCVDETLTETGISLNSMTYQNLIVHLAITIMRIQDRCCVSLAPETLQELEGTSVLNAAQVLSRRISQAFEVELPQEEIVYIAIHLAGKQSLRLPSNGDDSGAVISDEVWDIVTRMIECVRRTFRFDFTDDLELRMNLACHVGPLIVRLRYRMTVDNPILQDIRARFPLAYAMAHEASSVLSEAAGEQPSDEEVGFVAMAFELALERSQTELSKKNILVVCASGQGTARMLEHRYRQQFGDCVDRVIACDVSHIGRIDFSQIDYVFTTVPIAEKLPVPVREVGLFPDSAEVAGLRDLLTRDASSGSSSADRFLKRFDRTLFFPHLNVASKEEVLDVLCDAVEAAGGVSPTFRALVLEREALAPTAFGSGVAMPHPNEPVTDGAFVAVGLLDHPITWGQDNVQAVFLVALSREDPRELNEFFGALAQLFMDECAIQKLVQDQRWEVLTGLVEQIEQRP